MYKWAFPVFFIPQTFFGTYVSLSFNYRDNKQRDETRLYLILSL